MAKSLFPGYVLLTGAGGGLGLALTDYLLAQGVRNLVCQYRTSHADLDELFAIYDLAPEEHCLAAELTDEDQVAQLRVQANERFGALWGLVNLAGGCQNNAMSWKLTTADWQQVLNANLLTTFLCTQAFIPDLRAQGNGRIVNVTSVAAFAGAIGAAHYAAAKAAIVGYTKTVALELAPRGVTANAVALGYFDRGLIRQVSMPLQMQIVARTPVGRLGAGVELGGCFEFLLSADSSFMTGQVLHLNGGGYLA